MTFDTHTALAKSESSISREEKKWEKFLAEVLEIKGIKNLSDEEYYSYSSDVFDMYEDGCSAQEAAENLTL